MRDGIDLRDVEHVRDDRIRRRPTALGRDPALVAEPHDVPVDEEELREAAAIDHVELVSELLRDRRGHPAVLRACAVLAKRVQERERGVAIRYREPREPLVPEPEIEVAPIGDRARVRERRGVVSEPGAEQLLALQPALAVGGEPLPCLIDGAAEVDAPQHVVELARLGPRVAHVVRDDRRDAQLGRELRAFVAAVDIGRAPAVHQLHIEAVPEDLAQPRQRFGVVALRKRDEPVGLIRDERERRDRLRLLARELRGGHDPAEARPAGPIEPEQRHRIGIDQVQLHTEDRLDPTLARRVPEAHRAVEAVRVGERERVVAQLDRGIDEIVDRRRAIEERIAAVRTKVNELARHLGNAV